MFDENSVAIMSDIDGLSKPMRALVREYGYKIVRAMIDDGYADPFQLAELLEAWRERRQREWLDTDYITRRSAQSIADAIAYRMADRAA